jgi:hypothetical protein
MQALENFLADLQSRLAIVSDPQKIEAMRFSPLLEEHELAQAAYALLAQRYGLKPFQPQLLALPSGAVPLLRKGFFPWGALPYPKQHAELGTLLVQLEDGKMQTIAHQMARFQEATLDHHKKPLYSLFQQEGAISRLSLEEANTKFFEAIRLTPSPTLQFVDHALGMLVKRSETATLLCAGCGCKSGMGVYLSYDAGIVNFGPQMLPLGDCGGFGLAGSAQKVHLQDEADHFSLSYRCRLASPNMRKTGFCNLQDSGYSGLWIEAEIEGDINGISLRTHFAGFSPLNRVVFSFFGKGEACFIAGSHKLNPRSLDRYQGPAQPLTFVGKEGKIRIDALEGRGGMEVIPLAGDDSFWGADFLAAYTLATPSIAFSINL